LRRGEIQCNWILYDLEKETKTELFQLALPGKLTIKEVKEELIKHWNELQTNKENNGANNNNTKDGIVLPNDPSRLRLRHLSGLRPDTIFMDDKTLKEATQMKYYSTECYIQILPEGKTETKTSDDTVVIILRQFHPENYELGIPWEFDAYKDEKLGDFRDRICKITGIPSLSLARADQYSIQKILQIPYFKWYPKLEEEEDSVVHHPEKRVRTYTSYQDVTYDPGCFVRSLNLSEGSILLYRDLGVPLKILTEEEEKKIKEDEEKKRRALYIPCFRKEERLDIKVTDVDL